MIKRKVETERISGDTYMSLIMAETRRGIVAQTQKIFGLPLARSLQNERELLAAT